MCGVVGIFAYGQKGTVSASVLRRMRDTMVHRGPDGGDEWISADGDVGLGHRRLSIVDLSTLANQPISN